MHLERRFILILVILCLSPYYFQNVLVHLADPLSKQLKPGTKMMVS